MGNRYIDADALAKVLNITEECKDCAYHWGTHNGGFFCGKSSEFANACEAIFDAPTADVVPVKHGKWTRLEHDAFNCNLCGTTFMLIQGISKMNYCPNCGAKMDE